MEDSRPIRDIASLFVGRRQEMEVLEAALNDAMSGRGRLVMLAGEPGIGKTRTARELASYAENLGVQVFWGRCYEDEGTPPYWPWVQAIRSYVQLTDAEQLASAMGSGAADIAEVVPDIRSKLTDLTSVSNSEPETARFRLLDSITGFLKTAAQRQALMLVLDDLHWADRSSLLLLEHLVREIGESQLLLVGCYRDTDISRQHTLSDTLAQVSREPVFRRQSLRGLEQEDLGRFVESASGVALSQELIETIYAHTEGNPFFMTEVVRLLSKTGGLTAENVGTPEGLRIPEGVREVIGQRLNRLSEPCNEVLTTASIIGREFDFRLLNLLSGEMSEDQLLRVIDEVVSFHLIEEVPSQMDRYQFTHALVQQTLAEEVTTSRRVRLHARIAEGLEEIYGDGVESHPAELAHHFSEAQTLTGPSKLVRYSLLAGERSLAAYAHEDALGYFETGLAARDIAMSGTEVATDEEAAALLFGLARAQSATIERHQVGEVVASLRRAFEYFAQAGDVSQAVAVAEYPVFAGTDMRELLERALTMVAPDSHEEGRLLSRHGGCLGRLEGGYDDAQEAFSRALTIARREGDQTLETRALTDAGGLAYLHLHHKESLQMVLSAIELARRVDDPRAEVTARFYAVGAYYIQGELEEAGRHATEALPAAEKLRDRIWLSGALWRNDIVAHLAGDWRRAREFNDRGLAISGQPTVFLCTRALLEYETGELEHAEAYLERLMTVIGPVSPASGDYAFHCLVPALADRITGGSKWSDVVVQAAERVVAASPPPIYIVSAKAALGLVAALRADADSAAEQYGYLKQYKGIVVPGILRSVDRILGILSQTMGNSDQVAVHFEDAMTFWRQAGFRPELAWSCCDYADALQERGDQGDNAKAASLSDEALAIATELGMRPLMGAGSRAARVDPGPAGNVSGLSRRFDPTGG
ncbi:MAG: hypothetical protein CMJ45_14245 [Planctomyces sp.]|nr:hypothetical protein [Planctomyces sp.]